MLRVEIMILKIRGYDQRLAEPDSCPSRADPKPRAVLPARGSSARRRGGESTSGVSWTGGVGLLDAACLGHSSSWGARNHGPVTLTSCLDCQSFIVFFSSAEFLLAVQLTQRISVNLNLAFAGTDFILELYLSVGIFW